MAKTVLSANIFSILKDKDYGPNGKRRGRKNIEKPTDLKARSRSDLDQPKGPLKRSRLPKKEHQAYQKLSLPSENRLPSESSLSGESLWDSLQPTRGHLQIPNLIVDRLLQLLTPNEQSVYIRLYRLSHGFGKDSCLIGLPGLSRSCNMSKTGIQNAVAGLIEKGLIEKTGSVIGKDKPQGTNYRVLLGNSLLSQGRLPAENSLPRKSRNKEDLKNKIIKTAASISKEQAGAHPDQIVEMVRSELGRQGIVVEREEIRGLIF